MLEVGIWIFYIALFVFLARKGAGHDSVMSGSVGFFVQSFAYVATYFSAVALVGFGGLAYMYGLQMMIVALGNVLLGTLFVYVFFAWRTKELQTELNARTPAQLIALGHKIPILRFFLGMIFAIFLSVYAAAVVKGAAIMLQGILPFSLPILIWIIVAAVGMVVLFGGLKGVLLTEAMQGCVMLIGIGFLAYTVLSKVGGPLEGIIQLAELPANAKANNGFTSFSSGGQGFFVMSLMIVTSIAVWAQPQMIQRHFSISNKRGLKKSLVLASVSSLVLVGGMYFISSLSRLILPEIAHPDDVIPTLVDMYLPTIGKQFFILAIVSASLSTCTALFHIASSSLSEDMTGKKANKKMWLLAILFCIIVSGITAQIEGQIIAIIHTTAWSVIGATALVPYATLVLWKQSNAKAALCSALTGFVTCLSYYLFISPSTKVIDVFAQVPQIVESFPPFVVGTACSALVFALLSIRKRVTIENLV